MNMNQIQMGVGAQDMDPSKMLGAGPIGGMMLSQRLGDQRGLIEQQNLNNLMMMLSNQNQLTEYADNAEVRSTKRASDIATNTAEAATVGGRKTGELEKLQRENRVGNATEATGIAATNSKNRTQVVKDNLDRQEAELDSINQVVTQLTGPDAQVKFEEWADSNGIGEQHPMRQALRRARSPEEFRATATALTHKATQNLATRRRMLEQAQKDEAAMDRVKEHEAGATTRQGMANQSALAVANARSQQERLRDLEFKVRRDVVKLPDIPFEQQEPQDQQTLEIYDQFAQEKFAKQMANFKERQQLAALLGDGPMVTKIDEQMSKAEKDWMSSQPKAYRRWKTGVNPPAPQQLPEGATPAAPAAGGWQQGPGFKFKPKGS